MSPSDTEQTDDVTTEADPLEEFAAEVADVVGGTPVVTFGTVKISVEATRWREAVQAARDGFGLVYFSWLSATHWANDVAVGDPLGEAVTERYELLCAIGDLSEGRIVILSADLDAEAPSVESLVTLFPGANWHEREAHDMFGIVFEGHPGLDPLYLPDAFAGHPLRKSYPLLSREVKPWPGKVDVEGMPAGGDEPADETNDTDESAPSTENPEA